MLEKRKVGGKAGKVLFVSNTKILKRKFLKIKNSQNSDQDFLTWQSCCMDQGRNNWLTFFFLTNTKAMSQIWILSPLPHAPGKEELARKICKFKIFFLQFFSNLLIRSRKKGKNLCLKHGIYKRIWCTLHDAWNYSIILGGQWTTHWGTFGYWLILEHNSHHSHQWIH